MDCPNCNKPLSDQAAVCPDCGHPMYAQPLVSPKSQLAVILLCLFLGGFGVHRFYVGKYGTGILMLLTLGCLGIWTLIDFIFAVIGKFTDANGLPVQR